MLPVVARDRLFCGSLVEASRAVSKVEVILLQNNRKKGKSAERKKTDKKKKKKGKKERERERIKTFPR